MIKALFILFYFILSPFTFAEVSLEKETIEQAKKMIKLIQQARSCEVTEENGDVLFCTGLKLKKSDLSFLKSLELKQCKHFLGQMGHDVIEASLNSRPKKISKDIWQDFFGSTKLALILHGPKLILFKNKAQVGDCVHEVIHFYQRHRMSNHPLTPINRKQAEKRLLFLLEKEIVKVENLEKKRKIKEAKALGSKLKSIISLQKEWMKMIDWLDEKEVYEFLFKYKDELNLSIRDWDIAISNLMRLKESLSWQMQEKASYWANELLNKKYANIKTPKSIKGYKSSAEYSRDYEKGHISRAEFENRVIALRKYQAHEGLKDADSLLEKLKSLSRMRLFKEAKEVKQQGMSLKFKIKDSLLYTKINESDVIIDTGAQLSVMNSTILDGLSLKDIRLLKTKRVSLEGKSLNAPYIQILRTINIGGQDIKGARFAIADLGLNGLSGVLGMDFFASTNLGRWSFDLKGLKGLGLKKATNLKSGVDLIRNGLGLVDNLIYKCANLSVRIDTGSQVYGDYSELSGAVDSNCFSSDEYQKMNKLRANSLYFSRGVFVNLGMPYLVNKYKILSFDLSQAKMRLE